jgi:hypothetical protein
LFVVKVEGNLNTLFLVHNQRFKSKKMITAPAA